MTTDASVEIVPGEVTWVDGTEPSVKVVLSDAVVTVSTQTPVVSVVAAAVPSVSVSTTSPVINVVMGQIIELSYPTITGSGVFRSHIFAIGWTLASMDNTSTLSAATMQRFFSSSGLLGSNQLVAQSFARYHASTSFSTSGVVTGKSAPLFHPCLAAAGQFSTATTAHAYITAHFGGVGSASASTVERITAPLHSTGVLASSTHVVQREAVTAAFSASGVVASSSTQVLVAAEFAGMGSASAHAVQGFSRTASVSGAGALHSAAVGQTGTSPQLASSGALSATARMYRLAVSASLSSAGTATAVAKNKVRTALSGAGQFTAQARMSSLHVAAALAGRGTAAATPVPHFAAVLHGGSSLLAPARMYRLAVSVSFAGLGTTAPTARMFSIRRTAVVAGIGTLSPRVSQGVSLTTALAGTGRLSAGAVGWIAPTMGFDSVGAGVTSGSGASPLNKTWAHTAGTGPYLLVVMAVQSAGTSDSPANWTRLVKYDTQTASSLGSVIFDTDTGTEWVEVFAAPNIVGGAKNVTVTLTKAGGSITRFKANSIAYDNAQANGGLQITNGNSSSPSMTMSSSSGDLAFGGFASFSAIYAMADFGARWASLGTGIGLQFKDVAGATSTAFSTTAGSTLHWGGFGVDLQPTTPLAIVSSPFRGNGQLAATTTHSPTASPAFAGSGLLAATATISSIRESATLVGAGVLSAKAVPMLTARLSGVGTSTSAARLYEIGRTTALSGAGVLSAKAALAVKAAVSGTGTASAKAVVKLAATLPAVGTLSPAARMYEIGIAASLSGHGVLSTTARMSRLAVSASFTGSGTASTTITHHYEGISGAALVGAGVFSASASMYRVSRTATLSSSAAVMAKPVPKCAVALAGSGQLSTAVMWNIAPLRGNGVLTATANTGYLDNFHRANSSTLGANWVNAFGSGADFAIYNNMAEATTSGNAADVYATPMLTDNMRVSVTLASTPVAGTIVTIPLRSNASGSSKIYLQWTQAGGWWQAVIISSSAGTVYDSGIVAGTLLAAGDSLFFEASGAVYSYGKNNAVLGFCSSAGATPIGSLYRIVGMQYQDPGGTATAGKGISLFVALDVLTKAVASFTGGGTVSAAARMDQIGRAATLSGSGTLTKTIVPKRAVAAALPGHGVLSATAISKNVFYDSQGSGYQGQSTTPSFSHTIGGNATALVVAINGYSPSQANVNFWIRTVKVGTSLGTAVTVPSLGSQNCNNAAQGWVELFCLLNPPTGALNIYVSSTYSTYVPYLSCFSVAFIGVKSIGTLDKNYGLSTTQTTHAVASTAATDAVVATSGALNGVYTTWNSIGISNQAGAANYVSNLMQYRKGSATETLTSVTNSTYWATAAVNLVGG